METMEPKCPQPNSAPGPSFLLARSGMVFMADLASKTTFSFQTHTHFPAKFGQDRPVNDGGDREQRDRRKISNYSMISAKYLSLACYLPSVFKSFYVESKCWWNSMYIFSIEFLQDRCFTGIIKPSCKQKLRNQKLRTKGSQTPQLSKTARDGSIGTAQRECGLARWQKITHYNTKVSA